LRYFSVSDLESNGLAGLFAFILVQSVHAPHSRQVNAARASLIGQINALLAEVGSGATIPKFGSASWKFHTMPETPGGFCPKLVLMGPLPRYSAGRHTCRR